MADDEPIVIGDWGAMPVPVLLEDSDGDSGLVLPPPLPQTLSLWRSTWLGVERWEMKPPLDEDGDECVYVYVGKRAHGVPVYRRVVSHGG